MLIGGLAEIDIQDWRANTEYRTYTANDNIMKWFWEIVESWDNEMRSRLLQFVTGTSRVPGSGFKDLWGTIFGLSLEFDCSWCILPTSGSDGLRRFCIERWGQPTALPRSHTCFNRIDLPPYASKEVLQQKLTLAIENSAGFAME